MQTITVSLGLEFVDLSGFDPPTDIVRLIPAGLALLHRVFPIGIDAGTLQVVLADPLQSRKRRNPAAFRSGQGNPAHRRGRHQIDELIKKHYWDGHREHG